MKRTLDDILKGENETIFRMKCSQDPIFFMDRVIGPQIHPNFSRDLDEFHKQMIRDALRYRFVMHEAFRGSLKSTIHGVCLPLWLMAFQPKK